MPCHVYRGADLKVRGYVGCTGRDPLIRLSEHNQGLNRWTKANGPWRLVYSEESSTKKEALQRERFFKTGTGRRLRDELIAREADHG